MKITRAQFNALLSFYTHCHCVYHDKIQANFTDWAIQLDELAIPFTVQNLVAELARTKSNIGFYFTTLLNKNNITVQVA